MSRRRFEQTATDELAHTIREIEILGFPDIEQGRHADPGGFEISIGANGEICRVGCRDRSGVGQIRLQAVVRDRFARS